jgi:hypothetical protein
VVRSLRDVHDACGANSSTERDLVQGSGAPFRFRPRSEHGASGCVVKERLYIYTRPSNILIGAVANRHAKSDLERRNIAGGRAWSKIVERGEDLGGRSRGPPQVFPRQRARLIRVRGLSGVRWRSADRRRIAIFDSKWARARARQWSRWSSRYPMRWHMHLGESSRSKETWAPQRAGTQV